ncbi:MAG: DUF421 domain-containing protein [Firmicutes bacterium]|nr:DUF421 domain-containing protein [Bacillota bacterium]
MEFNFIEVLDVIARSLLSLMVLFLVTKILGKKQVSQLSMFDYVIGISIGNFAAEMTTDLELSYVNGITAVLVFGFVAYLVSYFSMKSIILRRFFIGTPTVLIKDGKILVNSLRKCKFDINDLLEECRVSGYFDISQIEYALLEANGKLSILSKGEYLNVTIKDMDLPPKKQGLCANVVIDGKIMKNNLKFINKNEKWLWKELKIKGYNNLKSILLATVDNNEKLMIYEKNENTANYEILE